MASASAATRKALRGLEDGLSVFTGQLAQEAAELRRNVENRPCTGPSFYRAILEDLGQRLEGLGEELAALEAVSVDTVSLEVGAGGRWALGARMPCLLLLRRLAAARRRPFRPPAHPPTHP